MTKFVKPDIAQNINDLIALLKRDFGTDFSFYIHANGTTVAQSNITGIVPPKSLPIPLTTPRCTVKVLS